MRLDAPPGAAYRPENPDINSIALGVQRGRSKQGHPGRKSRLGPGGPDHARRSARREFQARDLAQLDRAGRSAPGEERMALDRRLRKTRGDLLALSPERQAGLRRRAA